jgi:hypothetical protein
MNSREMVKLQRYYRMSRPITDAGRAPALAAGFGAAKDLQRTFALKSNP